MRGFILEGKVNKSLIDWIYIYSVLISNSLFEILHSYWDPPPPFGEGMQNLAVCSLSREGSLSCHTLSVAQDLGFCGLIQRTASFSRLLRKERGTDWLLILTRIPTKLIYSFCLFWRSFISNRTEEYPNKIIGTNSNFFYSNRN